MICTWRLGLPVPIILGLRSGVRPFTVTKTSLGSSRFKTAPIQSPSLKQRVQSYIRSHYAEKLTLEALAAQVNISVSQLKRTYKDQTGSSVIAYLTKVRISEAKRLIRESNHNFTQIAELTGYDNIYYFSRRFKEETKMTPTEYALSLRR